MGQTEYKVFIVLATLIVLVFIAGIVIFIVQYHKRKLIHEQEKLLLNEEHQRALLNTKVEIQRVTMRDIGSELHDNVVQKLAHASILANRASVDAGLPDSQRDELHYVSEVINWSCSQLRSVSHMLVNTGMLTPVMEDQVEEHCAAVRKLGYCSIQCKFAGHPASISNTVKHFLMRIIQEFTANSLKHSECRNITLNFTYREDGLFLQAADDGRGFDASVEEPGDGIGLRNMKQRAELIGAQITFKSEIGKGTAVDVFIPAGQLDTVTI